jgi:hypothetical protein
MNHMILIYISKKSNARNYTFVPPLSRYVDVSVPISPCTKKKKKNQWLIGMVMSTR